MPNPAPGFKTGPAHKIEITPRAETFRVSRNGTMILESAQALELRESNYAPILYFPLEDARVGALTPSGHETYCPFKGRARYWSLAGEGGENAVWGYETPYDEAAQIKDHIAFYAERVAIEVIGE